MVPWGGKAGPGEGQKVLFARARGAFPGDRCEHTAVQDSREQIEPGELHFFSDRQPGSTLET